MKGEGTETLIKRFLQDNSDGHLYVVVGFASVWGLAWLQDHTRGRPVTVLIGETRSQHFENATDFDRKKALAFVDRGDVQVLNWYRSARSAQGKSNLHAKAWVITDRNGRTATAALIGSANLTKVGLRTNWEMMAAPAEHELPRLWAQLDGFIKGKTVSKRPWNARHKITEAIKEGGRTAGRPTRDRKAAPTHREARPTRKKGGCLALAATVSAATGVLITALLLLIG